MRAVALTLVNQIFCLCGKSFEPRIGCEARERAKREGETVMGRPKERSKVKL